jgi:hypothetical protein
MKTNNLLVWSAVAIGIYFIYNKMKKNSNPTGRELAPPPSSGGKPIPSVKPSVTTSENTIQEETAEGI